MANCKNIFQHFNCKWLLNLLAGAVVTQAIADRFMLLNVTSKIPCDAGAISAIVCEFISCKLFSSEGNATIQYSPNLPSSPSPPHSPGTGTDTPLNSVTMVSANVGMPGQDGVQVLVDSGGTTPGMLVQGANRGRGRGGRGSRGRGGGRGRRSTSGPPPEIDHNIEVNILSL